jgi:DNA-binding winged helix-turn-helix (wHTH) protein
MVYNAPMLRQSDAPAIIEFGHFSILPHRRQLLADGQPMRLGGRAFDVLMALIEASGTVVSKDELLSRVWQGRIVDEPGWRVRLPHCAKPLAPTAS